VRAPLILLVAGVGTMAAGAVLLVRSALDYIEHPYMISSVSGNVVLRLDGQLVAYAPFAEGIAPTVIGVGLVLVVGAAFIAAAARRPRASD
jgi:hypothetical protein